MPAYRLHHCPESGNSYKVALTLALLGQEWEPVWTDYFGGETRRPEWRAAVNAMGEIPVLEDGADRLTQSGAILPMLAERHGGFGPADERGRWEILRWLLWDNHKLTSFVATYRWMRCFAPDHDPAVVAFVRGRAEGALGVLEGHLAGRAFILGERPTVADLSLCAYLSYPGDETGFDLPATHPAIAGWLSRIAALPGWRAPYDLLPGPRAARLR
ncbi:glutathione S-transferase family protein [Roseomonas sp. CCTCC AB2023176]|uniref:glutathione S-transferase family protein n=1 Tax=Roseomonas sp. CCTCC AB2023176 TaxID=3342640 RepID=UPI0035DBAC93